MYCGARQQARSSAVVEKLRTQKATLENLMIKRYPIYAEADLVIESRDVGKDIIVTEVLAAVAGRDLATSKNGNAKS